MYSPEFALEIFGSMEERDMDHFMSVQLEKLTKLLKFLRETCRLERLPRNFGLICCPVIV